MNVIMVLKAIELIFLYALHWVDTAVLSCDTEVLYTVDKLTREAEICVLTDIM